MSLAPIKYSGFHNRLFASMLDLMAFWLISGPINYYFSKVLYDKVVISYTKSIGVDPNDPQQQQQFLELISSTSSPAFKLLVFCTVLSFIINIIIIGFCYLTCWFRWKNTPGKLLMQLKIVDNQTLQTPSKKQFITRFLGYLLCPLNIFLMPLTNKTLGIQDIFAGTVVIKK